MQSKRVHYFLLFFAWGMFQNVMFGTLTLSSASQLLPYLSRKRRDVEFLTETERFRKRTYVLT
jgi:hypothetical protein